MILIVKKLILQYLSRKITIWICSNDLYVIVSPKEHSILRGHYFPVCARCTGFYIGAFSYFAYVYFFYVQYSVSLILLAILMIIPTFLDGFTQLTRSQRK